MLGAELPQMGETVFLTDGGVETDLIFHRGVELPEFASFVLHENAEGEAVLRDYYLDYLEIASQRGFGLVLGYVKFCALCSIGLAANLAVASSLYRIYPEPMAASVAGAVFGALWNYVSTAAAVW